jgi:hypothetical protein
MINEEGHLIISWCIEDVMDRAEEQGIPCTEEQAHNILASMDHHHDCNYGITWDTIDFWLSELK